MEVSSTWGRSSYMDSSAWGGGGGGGGPLFFSPGLKSENLNPEPNCGERGPTHPAETFRNDPYLVPTRYNVCINQ